MMWVLTSNRHGWGVDRRLRQKKAVSTCFNILMSFIPFFHPFDLSCACQDRIND